ncbi:esterase/lipase family protein [Hydrogenophaga luteola]|uniref:esterase/lipase family protein n=1 Tax=Hydrogenophaga luteola TaxID=1591122 RepID=UPI0036D2C01F
MQHPHPSGMAATTSSSILARLQQLIVFATVGLVAGWVAWSWGRPGWVVAAGGALLLFGYALVLGLEFFAVAHVNRRDPAPRATIRTLMNAWWREVLVAPRVFSWRQPFRWRGLPDNDAGTLAGQPAVVFVHGFVCNRGFWLPWMRTLRSRGLPYTSVNLEPVFGSIDDYIPLIDDAVRRAHALTGVAPVLVCHSMGGLAVRAWRVATPDADTLARHIVTIGSPHHGTWLAQFSHVPNGRQMRQNGPWLRALRQSEAQRWPTDAYAPFTCWYSSADNIVFPASTATLPGADNRFVHGQPHVAMAFADEVMEGTLSLPAFQGRLSL